jgi:hypothetical protein
MSSASIRTFNPFDVQHGSDQKWHERVQEIIYYGDSRFRQALAHISKADPKHHLWMQMCLKEELVCQLGSKLIDCLTMSSQVFIMSYVGIATSLGLVIEVPMVLRSLCASLAALPDGELPIPFDSEFIRLLDSGTNDEELARIVKSYALPWWKGIRRPAEGGALTTKTIQQCLEEHRLGLGETMAGEPMRRQPVVTIPPIQLNDGTRFGSDHVYGDDSQMSLGADSHMSLGADSGESFSASFTATVGAVLGAAPCANCNRYRSLASDLLTELSSLTSFSSGMLQTTSNQSQLAERSTMGFYALHEKVIKKELLSESHRTTVKHSIPGTKAGKLSVQISMDAREELRRLQDLPSGSHKWTWGSTLRKEDVRSLRYISGQRIRSGYDTSLKPGNFAGECSSAESSPGSPGSDSHSLLSAEAHQAPPPTSLLYPALFHSSNGAKLVNIGSALHSPPYSERNPFGIFLAEVSAKYSIYSEQFPTFVRANS